MDVQILRCSLETLAPQGDALMKRFYELLFEKYPQVKPLFANTPMAEQRGKLLRAIALIVGNLEKPGVLMPYLEGLGRMHVAYGAEPAHYGAVGECLIQALAETAGPLWSKDLESAWKEAYTAAAEIMVRSARAPASV